jgi:hypothetical protein
MKIYVKEKQNQSHIHEENQDDFLNQEKIFEDIDFTKKNDEKNNDDQFMYNLNINSSNICKKCDIKRKKFKFNNSFHVHIRECIDDEKFSVRMMILRQSKRRRTLFRRRKFDVLIESI